MKKLFIRRFKNVDDGTLGEFLLLDSSENVLLNGYTLEPSGPDTTTSNQDKRIPQGEYSLGWHNSPTFNQKLPLLHNESVPKERCILIHAGNYPKDTLGCVLVGLKNDGANVQESKKALKRLLPLLKGVKKVIIENSDV